MYKLFKNQVRTVGRSWVVLKLRCAAWKVLFASNKLLVQYHWIMSFCLSLNNPKHIKHVLCLCFVLPQPGKIRTRTKNHFTDPARTVLSYSGFSFRRRQRCERIVLSFVRSCAVFIFASVLDYCSTSWIHVRRCEHFSWRSGPRHRGQSPPTGWGAQFVSCLPVRKIARWTSFQQTRVAHYFI